MIFCALVCSIRITQSTWHASSDLLIGFLLGRRTRTADPLAYSFSRCGQCIRGKLQKFFQLIFSIFLSNRMRDDMELEIERVKCEVVFGSRESN